MSERLTDINWSVLLAQSSDKVANLEQQPLVRLQLAVSKGDASSATSTTELACELTKPELDNLIAELERAQKAIESQ